VSVDDTRWSSASRFTVQLDREQGVLRLLRDFGRGANANTCPSLPRAAGALPCSTKRL
jgi:hypothetical protein